MIIAGEKRSSEIKRMKIFIDGWSNTWSFLDSGRDLNS